MPDPRPLPDDFLFGVATAGFQIEGGYNGPGEPRNNWFRFETEGRVEPSGVAVGFWDDYERHLDRVAATGCNAFRFSVEWARVEPSAGEIDTEALARYRAIADACHERGIEPLVTLHHFTHPWWLGEDFWQREEAPERFAAWAQIAVGALSERVRHWVTVNEINICAIQTWLTGDFPPAKVASVAATARAMDHLLAGHVLAYEVIHAARPDAIVGMNNFVFSLYELDRLHTDVLSARAHGVDRAALRGWLVERRASHRVAFSHVAGPERLLRAFSGRRLDLDRALPRTVEAVYASPHTRTLDHVQVDWYNAITSSHFRMPGHRSAGGRNWLPVRALWDDPPKPDVLTEVLPLSAEEGIPLWVVENGLCNRVRNGRSHARLDGWDRPRYLQAHLRALMELHDRGHDIGAYFHWTLADNYEWGSYEPRFGLYGVDRARGVRWSDRDAMGHDAAGAYRRLIDGLRSGDRRVLTCPSHELEDRR